jgi:hypothetical protein
MRDGISIQADGYIHAGACPERVLGCAQRVEWVSNGSAVGLSFDNFQVTTMRGKMRQINRLV